MCRSVSLHERASPPLVWQRLLGELEEFAFGKGSIHGYLIPPGFKFVLLGLCTERKVAAVVGRITEGSISCVLLREGLSPVPSAVWNGRALL